MKSTLSRSFSERCDTTGGFAASSAAKSPRIAEPSFTSLLLRPARCAEESRGRYMQHLAIANHLQGIEDLSKILGVTLSDLFRLTDRAFAQVIRGIPVDQTAPPRFRDPSVTQLARHHLWLRSRVCPACIAECRVASIELDYPLSVRCQTHRLMLVDHCNICAQPLMYLRRSLLHCDCGQPLSELPRIPAGSVADLFHCVFSPWRISKGWAVNEAESIVAEVQTALVLNVIIKEALGKRSYEVRSKPWIQMQDWPIICALLDDFPCALVDHIQNLASTKSDARRSELLTSLEDRELPILGKVISEVRARFPLRDTTPAAEHSGNIVKLVALNQIREVTKLDTKGIMDLFEGDFFSVTTTSDRDKGGKYWIPRIEAGALAAWISATADSVEAGSILGCHPRIIYRLTQIGMLAAEYLPGKTRSPRYRRSHLDQHLISLMAHVQPSRKASGLVPLSRIAPSALKGNVPFKGWIRLIEGIFSGRIETIQIRCQIGWSAAGVRKQDVERFLGRDWKKIDVSDSTSPV